MNRIKDIKQLTNVKFLNLYELTAENKKGVPRPYYVASRKDIDHLAAKTKQCKADGVLIYSLYGDAKDQLIMVRQFRNAINDYIYELPAGLIDPRETAATAAIREMKEETGLCFAPVDTPDYLNRPHYSSVGMTDEANCTIYGYATGTPSKEFLEPNEDISVVLVDKKEAKRIIKEENLSVKAYYLLLHFLQADPSDPFGFIAI